MSYYTPTLAPCNGHLSTMATCLCFHGGCWREIQMYLSSNILIFQHTLSFNIPMLQTCCFKLIYNITKAKRALWLVNLASTICPWVYAADVCANVYKANLLTDIVSKVMTNVLLPEMRNCLLSCLKMKLNWVTGVQSVVMNEFSRTCFLLSCKTTRTFFCDVAQ